MVLGLSLRDISRRGDSGWSVGCSARLRGSESKRAVVMVKICELQHSRGDPCAWAL